MGLRQHTIDEVAVELGLPSTVEAVCATVDDPAEARSRLADAFTCTVDDISLDGLVGGYASRRPPCATATGRPIETTWLEVPTDLLVPATMAYALTSGNAGRVRARAVVEGANLPSLPDSGSALARRGIPVVSDFLANVMTDAWWWVVVGETVERDSRTRSRRPRRAIPGRTGRRVIR